MPMPVSATRTTASSPSPLTRTRIVPPGGVYFAAFASRFETIWSSRVGSACAHAGSAWTSTMWRSSRPVPANTLTHRWTLVARFSG